MHHLTPTTQTQVHATFTSVNYQKNLITFPAHSIRIKVVPISFSHYKSKGCGNCDAIFNYAETMNENMKTESIQFKVLRKYKFLNC